MPVCRILPLVRAYMSFPAGAARMRYGRFLGLSALGGVPWIVFWGVLGRALGSHYHSIQNNLHYVDIAAVVLIVAAVAYLVVRRRQAARDRRVTAPPDAYARAGVDTGEADRGVRAIVDVLRTIDPGRPSRSRLRGGHYASVLEIAPGLGIALSTDGVGSKLILAEQLGRLDTVGIDCVAMNVNDIVCVGAEPIALLDYIAVERADPAALGQVALGLKRGAELAGVEIPGGELAVLPEMIRGHPSPGRPRALGHRDRHGRARRDRDRRALRARATS